MRVADRIAFYMRYTTLLDVSAGSDVDRATMQPFRGVSLARGGLTFVRETIPGDFRMAHTVRT